MTMTFSTFMNCLDKKNGSVSEHFKKVFVASVMGMGGIFFKLGAIVNFSRGNHKDFSSRGQKVVKCIPSKLKKQPFLVKIQ